MKKHPVIWLLALLMMLSGCTPSADSAEQASATAVPDTKEINLTSEFDLSFSDRDIEGTWNEKEAVQITGSGAAATIDGKGATLSGMTLTISSEGVYHISGEFTDMTILVAAGDTDKVQLVLDNAVIANTNGPALQIESADKVFITLPEGTKSQLSDGEVYAAFDSESTLDAAIFSRADLTLNGKGTLNVTGQYKHGIVSKDDLRICDLTLNVTSASTALDGKDCVKMTGALVTLDAGSNGIRSDNAEDAARGFVYIRDCTLVIHAGNDGIQAETMLRADSAVMTITTGSGSSASLRYASGSWKGLKAGGDLLLNGGAYSIDSQDDCIHTNGNLYILSGLFTLSSGDDGIHADDTATVSGGEITVSRSYEGLEASHIIISGGKLDLTASDDGLNAAGGADGSSMGNRFGRGMFSNGVGEIDITGGYTVINASGDGIDSNANITVSGGVTLVSGPVSSGNAAFDYDGTATVTGGVLMAAGSSGMAQNFSSAENQGALYVSFNRQQSGRSIALLDAAGQVVAAFSPENTCQSIVITAPEIQQGQTYTLVAGAEINGADEHGFARNTTLSGGTQLESITMTSLVYGGGGGFGNWRNQPGGGGDRWRGW